nr:histidine kinase [Streptomyces corynorhini]
MPLALLCLAVSLLPAFHTQGTRIGGVPDRAFDALGAAAVLLQCLPLALRRRLPVVCVALVSVGFAMDQLLGYHTVAGTTLPIALFSAGAWLARVRRGAALAFSAAFLLLVAALQRVGSGESPGEYVTFYLALAFACGIGSWLRRTRAAEVELRRRIAEDTITAERTRIARELHDVVTHHVTAMVVQAEAARYLTAAPDRLDQTLSAVSDTGRRAITDLRHLLDLLNPDHSTPGHSTPGRGDSERRDPGHRAPEHGGPGPAPEAMAPLTGGFHPLVEQARRAGQPVEFTEEGTPAEASGSAGLVAYRVVQEALTNALKYAHGSRTSVRVRHSGTEITVEVGTDGSGARAGLVGGSGRGLAGLRERVDILGGDFSAGRDAAGGFVVQARIPAGAPS